MFDFPKYTETELNTWKDADFECTTPIVVCSDDIDFYVEPNEGVCEFD